MKLNPEQKEAVQHYKGPLIVTAVPGSGKTATLTNRVIYLIKHYGVDPKNICCLTFTNKAANEMRERISHALGEEIASKIWISTFHSYCLAILRKYGEHVKLRKSFSVYDDKDQIELITKIARMHEYECQAWVIKQMGSVINDLRENLCSMKDAGVLLGVGKNRDADTEKAILKEYVQSLDEFNAVDFSGILYKTYLLLYKKAPKTAEILANRHQYILVDEVQDTNNIQYEIVKKIASHNNLFVVGDIQQCVHESELIPVIENGKVRNIRASEIPKKGQLYSYKNSGRHISNFSSCNSDASSGYRITLESGKKISVSSNHRVYTTGLLDITPGRYFVYLMYRPDLGFRVGVTCRSNYGDRHKHECATKMWILHHCDNKEDALLEEQSISLKFGVPTLVFDGEKRGINQDRINRLFSKFGSNGFKVLDYYDLSFELPLWRAMSIDNGNLQRRLIYLNAHAPKGSQVTLEWSGNDINSLMEQQGFNVHAARRSKKDRWRVRKFCNKYTDAVNVAYNLSEKTGIPVIDRISAGGKHLILTTASALCVDSYLPIYNEKSDSLLLDRITKIEPISGNFISIEVEETSVFFNSDNILTHNSIFSWRGAKPENIELIERDFENTKRIVLPRNYRSTAKILEHAERLIRHNDNASDVNLISERGDGHAPIVRQFQSPEYESESIANAIQNYRCEGYKYGDMAVIYRTNQLSKSQELALRDKNIPYKMIGGFSFFDRKEIKTSLSYLSILANPKDTISFARAIAEPKRGVGPTNVGKLESFCKANDMDIIEACKHIDHMPGINKKAKSELKAFAAVVEKYQGQHADGRCIGEISNAFLRESGFYPYIEEESFKDDSSKKRLDNVNEFLLSVAEFSDSRKNAKFSDFLQTVKTFKETEQDDEDAVTLLTMHASKGLQFPIVFIIGVERDIIPHSRSVQENGENEERRLMYVAVTRAQDHLILSHCRMRPKNSFGHVKYSRSGPSPFLFELFEDLNVV